MTGRIVIREWKAINKGALIGVAQVAFPSGMVMNDVTILSGERGPWASPPGKPMMGRDGVQLTDKSGKARYSTVIEFTSKEHRDRFSKGVIEAMREAHPEALAT